VTLDKQSPQISSLRGMKRGYEKGGRMVMQGDEYSLDSEVPQIYFRKRLHSQVTLLDSIYPREHGGDFDSRTWRADLKHDKMKKLSLRDSELRALSDSESDYSV
jgi:hypothetical protein